MLFGRGDSDLQVHRCGRQSQCERADDREGQPQRDPAEAPAAGVVELAELRDRRGRRLDTRRQRHRDREREQHGEHRRPSARSLAVADVRDRSVDATGDHRDPGANKGERHQRECRSPYVPVPSESRDGDEQEKRKRDPIWREARHVLDQRRGTGRHADRDREDEVDDKGADRDERPPLPKRLPRGCRRTTTLREPRDKLVVVGDDQSDHRNNQSHRRQQQAEISMQSPQRRLDGVGDRGDGVGHHRKRKRQQEDRPAVEQAAAPAGWSPRRGKGRGCRGYLGSCGVG